MRLRARGGYLSTLILKWLTQKPHLRNRDWLVNSIQDPRSSPKVVQTLKRP